MSVTNAYFYSEKPLHARHTPHASARRTSLGSDLHISGRGLSARGVQAEAHPVPTADAAPVTQRKVRRVHAATTSLPEYRTYGASPHSALPVPTPRMGSASASHTDAPPPPLSVPEMDSAPVDSAVSRVAYVLYTPQGPRPLAPLTMNRVSGLTTTTTTSKPKPSALRGALASSPHMVDSETLVRCLYVKSARSQLLYVPPGTSVELGESHVSAAVPASASTSVTSPTASARTRAARANDHEASHAGPRVLGIQLCLTPDPLEEDDDVMRHTATRTHNNNSNNSRAVDGDRGHAGECVLTIECAFRGGRRLIFSNTFTELQSPQGSHKTTTTSRPGSSLCAGAGTTAARIPLHCLRAGEWAVLCLDLDSLQRTLFTSSTNSTARAASIARESAPRGLRSVRVTCGGGGCGVLVRRVVAMPALPPTQPPQAECVLSPLSETTALGHSHAGGGSVLLPDALRLPPASNATATTTATAAAAAAMRVVLVRTGQESVLLPSAGATPQAVGEAPASAPPPLPPAPAVASRPPARTEMADNDEVYEDEEGDAGVASHHNRMGRPTALAQLRAMLQAEDEAFTQRHDTRTAAPPHMKAAQCSQTVNDMRGLSSTASSSSPPPVPPKAVKRTPSLAQDEPTDEDQDEDAESFLVRHVVPEAAAGHVELVADSTPLSGRVPSRDPATTGAATASAGGRPPLTQSKSSQSASPPLATDMVTKMQDRIRSIHTVLRSGSTARSPRSRHASPALTGSRSQSPPLALGSAAAAAAAAAARTPSVSPSEDKAVQTDTLAAPGRYTDSRLSASHLGGQAEVDDTRRGTPPHGDDSGSPSHASHHFIPLSAMKDRDARPSQTYFGPSSHLFASASMTTGNDNSHVSNKDASRGRYQSTDTTLPDVAAGGATDGERRSSNVAASPFARNAPYRVLYHGDTPTPTLTSLAPMPVVMIGSASSPALSVPETGHKSVTRTSPSQPHSTGGRLHSAESHGMTATPTPTPDTATTDRTVSPAQNSAHGDKTGVRGEDDVRVVMGGDGADATVHTRTANADPTSGDASEPLTRRVLDFWSSTEQPLPPLSTSRPSTRDHVRTASSHHRHRHSRRSQEPAAETATQAPRSARHGDPTVSSLTSSTTAPRQSRHGDRERDRVDQLVFNSAQYESVEAWVASLDEENTAGMRRASRGREEEAEEDAGDAHAPNTQDTPVVAPAPSAYKALPSHRSVFAKLRRHLDISSSESSDASDASDTNAAALVRAAHGEERPVTVAELRSGVQPSASHDGSHSVATARTSWTFQSTSLVQPGSGQSTTHPWASSSLDKPRGFAREERWTSASYSCDDRVVCDDDDGTSVSVFASTDREAAKGSRAAATSAAAAASAALAALHNPASHHTNTTVDRHAERDSETGEGEARPYDGSPPPPPRFSLSASDGGGSVVVPPTPQPIQAALGQRQRPRDSPLVTLNSSIARQRAESQEYAEKLASRDAVRLGYEQVPSQWSDDGCSSRASSARQDDEAGSMQPTVEKGGTPLQWPTLRQSRPSRFSSGTLNNHPTTAADGRAPATGVPRIPAVRMTLRGSDSLPSPPDANKDKEEGEEREEAAAMAAEAAATGNALSSPTASTLDSSYHQPVGVTLGEHFRAIPVNTSPAMRYASTYSTSVSSLAPSACVTSSAAENPLAGVTASPVTTTTPNTASPLTAHEHGHSYGVPPRPQLHRHYSLPHLAQYHRLRSAGPVQVRPTQMEIQAGLTRAASAAPWCAPTNVAPEILLAPPPHLRKASVPSTITTGTLGSALGSGCSDRYLYDPVLDCYLDRHAHVYVEAADISM